jgi:hypothetical protein
MEGYESHNLSFHLNYHFQSKHCFCCYTKKKTYVSCGESLESLLLDIKGLTELTFFLFLASAKMVEYIDESHALSL